MLVMQTRVVDVGHSLLAAIQNDIVNNPAVVFVCYLVLTKVDIPLVMHMYYWWTDLIDTPCKEPL